ncbi:MAG: hypothetical protein EPN69_13365 [Rhodanobacter sp.]|nr:MAG: hypothetical protein EPN71_13910 [Rhodanobacter sp.]TAL89924.1 MAG: hypothetical protein EPN69_13365 [Rhodanobacter sp.]TAM41168.1 MAG: hypothetical protein EPN58_07665 [Rhodanobacter sp.]
MKRHHENETPRAIRRRAWNNTGTWASASGCNPTADARDTLCLALAAIDAARQQLNRYATATDAPAWQVVDAADVLDMVAAGVADAVTGGTRHVCP